MLPQKSKAQLQFIAGLIIFGLGLALAFTSGVAIEYPYQKTTLIFAESVIILGLTLIKTAS